MIILIDTEKAFHKIQPLNINSQQTMNRIEFPESGKGFY